MILKMMIIMMVQVPSWSYLNNPASHANTSHLMLKWFNSDLVLRNIQVSTSLKFSNSDKISSKHIIVYPQSLEKAPTSAFSLLKYGL